MTAYDARGNRIYERNQDSTREMAYDAEGRLLTVDDIETGRTITYGYDADGNRKSMSVSPDGDSTQYAWDGRGLLTHMVDPEGGDYRFGYDALGRRTSAAYPNGMTLSQSYDDASRILSMVYRDSYGQSIESFGYGYDARGNRTHKAFADGTVEQYGYDELSRLTSARYGSGRQVQYVYDAVGNRMSMVEGVSASNSATCAGDVDCDGDLDGADNCPSIYNPAQQDSDAGILNTANALGVWRFEEESGRVVRDAVATAHGVLQGEGQGRVEQGAIGRGLSMTNGAVKLPIAVLNGLTDLTFEAWIRTTGAVLRSCVLFSSMTLTAASCCNPDDR